MEWGAMEGDAMAGSGSRRAGRGGLSRPGRYREWRSGLLSRRFPEEIKLALLEAETWGEYQECELAMQEAGLTKAAAQRVALARYCPDELLPSGVSREDADPEHAKRKTGPKPGAGLDVGGAEPKPNRTEHKKRDSAPPGNGDDEDGVDGVDGEADDGGADDGGAAGGSWPDIGGLAKEAEREGAGSGGGRGKKKAESTAKLPELPAVTRNQFRRKEANEIEVIRWVARNMDIRDVKPADCPDAAAWRLLKKCRESRLFEQLFWQSMWTKVVPSRTQLEKESGPSEMDGTQEIATIDKIRVAAQKARDAAAEAESEAVAKMMGRRREMVPTGTTAASESGPGGDRDEDEGA